MSKINSRWCNKIRRPCGMGGSGFFIDSEFFKPSTICFLNFRIVNYSRTLIFDFGTKYWMFIWILITCGQKSTFYQQIYSHLVLCAKTFVGQKFWFGHAKRIGALEGGGDKRGDTGGLHHDGIGFLFNV